MIHEMYKIFSSSSWCWRKRKTKVQHLFRFENDYGASVVSHEHSYGGPKGLFELAVIQFHHDSWDIVYDTPITSDVIGWLEWTSSDAHITVEDLLEKIRILPEFHFTTDLI